MSPADEAGEGHGQPSTANRIHSRKGPDAGSRAIIEARQRPAQKPREEQAARLRELEITDDRYSILRIL